MISIGVLGKEKRIIGSFALGLGKENWFGWRGKCYALHLGYDGKILVSSGGLPCDFADLDSWSVLELSWHFGSHVPVKRLQFQPKYWP